MPGKLERFCWTDGIATMWITDDPRPYNRFITCSARIDRLIAVVEIDVSVMAYNIGAIAATTGGVDAFAAGYRRRGIATLLANSLLTYVQHLDDPQVPDVRGLLAPVGDHLLDTDVEAVARAREAFAARFGVQARSGESFRVPVAQLRPVPQFTLLGREVAFVPFSSFSPCTHDHR